MFKIEKISIIPTQAGNGLKIKDFEIGCARIVEVESDLEFDDMIEKSGLTVGYTTPAAKSDGDTDQVLLFDNHLKNAKNYVLVKIDKGGEDISVINSVSDICEIFGLSSDDEKMLGKYMSALASDRQLKLNIVSNDDDEQIMFFTNIVDVEITEDYISGELGDATNKYLNIMRSPDYRAEYFSDNFIKMFLITLITSCQDRYNKVHRDEVLKEVANTLSNITYWDDGQLLKPSILEIENYINDIKGVIRVE